VPAEKVAERIRTPSALGSLSDGIVLRLLSGNSYSNSTKGRRIVLAQQLHSSRRDMCFPTCGITVIP
jgi:hypothetical protein